MFYNQFKWYLSCPAAVYLNASRCVLEYVTRTRCCVANLHFVWLPHSLFLTVSTWKMTLTLRFNFFEQLLSRINRSMWTLAHPRPHSLLQESDHLSDQLAAHQHLESEISRGHSPTITQRVSSFQPVASLFHSCWVPGPAQNEKKGTWIVFPSSSWEMTLTLHSMSSARE